MSNLFHRIDTTHELWANYQDYTPDKNIIQKRLA